MAGLDLVTTPDRVPALRDAATLASIACFDRGIDRDHMVEAFSMAMAMNNNLGRLAVLNNFVKLLEGNKEPLTTEQLTVAVKEIITRTEYVRTKLFEKMKLVVQCPREYDIRH